MVRAPMMVDVTPGRACTHEIATRETVRTELLRDARHLVEEIVGLVVQRTGRQGAPPRLVLAVLVARVLPETARRS